MIASCTPVQAIVHAIASLRAARMLKSAEVFALATICAPIRSSARLALTVLIARSAPSSVPPSWPRCSCACSLAFAIDGITSRNRIVTTTTATTVVPSRTRSSTPISTSVPISITVLLMIPTRAEDAASLSSTVSDVTRVTSSPLGRLVSVGHGRAEVALDHRRARVEHDALAHRAQQPPLRQEDERAGEREREQHAGRAEQRPVLAERVQHPFRDQRRGEPGGAAEQRQ